MITSIIVGLIIGLFLVYITTKDWVRYLAGVFFFFWGMFPFYISDYISSEIAFGMVMGPFFGLSLKQFLKSKDDYE